MSFCGVLRTALGGRPHFTDGETKRGEVTQQVSVRAHHPDLYLDLKIQSEFLATVLMCLSFFFFLFFLQNFKERLSQYNVGCPWKSSVRWCTMPAVNRARVSLSVAPPAGASR